MIEKTVIDRLNAAIASVTAYGEVPAVMPAEFLVVEKTGGGRSDQLDSAVIAVQSYADSLYRAAQLNELVKACMNALPQTDSVFSSRLNADYNYTDPNAGKYRYQAVYDIYY